MSWKDRVTLVNEWVAVRMTKIFGTMYTAYLFFLYGFLPLIFKRATVTLLYWSNTVQLWALPLLMVGQMVLGRADERRAQQMFEMTQKIDRITVELHGLMETQIMQMRLQQQMLDTLVTMGETEAAVMRRVLHLTQEIDQEIDELNDYEDDQRRLVNDFRDDK